MGSMIVLRAVTWTADCESLQLEAKHSQIASWSHVPAQHDTQHKQMMVMQMYVQPFIKHSAGYAKG